MRSGVSNAFDALSYSTFWKLQAKCVRPTVSLGQVGERRPEKQAESEREKEMVRERERACRGKKERKKRRMTVNQSRFRARYVDATNSVRYYMADFFFFSGSFVGGNQYLHKITIGFENPWRINRGVFSFRISRFFMRMIRKTRAKRSPCI